MASNGRAGGHGAVAVLRPDSAGNRHRRRPTSGEASCVFVSYSHDDDVHQQRVQELVEHLREALGRHGVRVVFDADQLPGGPSEGWPEWSRAQIRRADRVLMVWSPCYSESYAGAPPPAGRGLGAAWETALIKQTLYDARGHNDKFRVVLLAGEPEESVALDLRRYQMFRLRQDEAALLAWLRPERAPRPTVPAGIQWPTTPAEWPPHLADRRAACAEFERMLRGQSAQRILLLRGPSGRGKTALLGRFADLVQGLGVAYAKVDLKGYRTHDDVLDTFTSDLAAACPSLRVAPRAERVTALLLDLERLRLPLVLAFDTYEQASDDMRRWIETYLLERLERCPGVIVVVAGQEVPDPERYTWRQLAHTCHLQRILRVDDWLTYCEYRRSLGRLSRQHVKTLTVAARGEPAHISQLLESLARHLP